VIELALATGIAPSEWRREGPRSWNTAIEIMEQAAKKPN
jgi:hypothetical protein